MEHQMLIGLIVAFVVGLVIGAGTLWLVVRKSAEIAAGRASSEIQIEMARVSERLSAQTTQLDTLRSSLEAAEAKSRDLQQQLETLQGESVRFEERAKRLPDLEEQARRVSTENEQVQRELSGLREKLRRAESTISAQQGRLAELDGEISRLSAERDKLLADQGESKAQMAELNALIEAERVQSAEKLALLTEAKDQLTATFKALANDILEENSARFTELNKANVAQILNPLKTKIQEFQAKVEEGKDRAGLAEQVKRLMELNEQLSDDANNLAQALKGSSKTLGNWGEMILERILENSGLRKNEEYFIRPTYTRQDGSRAQPDAVILLPESRSLVVDAKASLTAYDEYVRTDNDSNRAGVLQQHIVALRAHVNTLSIRNYQGLEGLNAPDFVVMFVPIESAFIDGVTNDRKLWEEAWKKNVLLVSPTSFLFVVRIVANLWTQEGQKRHFQEIARRGAELYDKLVGFTEDLRTVGQRLEQARDSYEAAYAKLCTGKGNVIRRAEILKELGVRPSKTLPTELVEAAMEVSGLPGGNDGQDTQESGG